MKVCKYYLKSNDRLFAMTSHKQLIKEFELIYDMSKFYKVETEYEDMYEYRNDTASYDKYKLWGYRVSTRGAAIDSDGNPSLIICMTPEMKDAITKATNNIRYTFKASYISFMRAYTIDGYNIPKKYLDALYILGHDEKNIFIDQYRIWADLYNDVISITASKNSNFISTNASVLLGIYKYGGGSDDPLNEDDIDL